MPLNSSTQECRVWRPGSGGGTAAGGFATVWPAMPHKSNVPVDIAKLSLGRSQRQFGLESDSRYEGWVDEGVGIQRKDVLELTAGALSGTYLEVVDTMLDEIEYEDRLELQDTRERPGT